VGLANDADVYFHKFKECTSGGIILYHWGIRIAQGSASPSTLHSEYGWCNQTRNAVTSASFQFSGNILESKCHIASAAINGTITVYFIQNPLP
jgi:hypothetical protein